MLELFRHSDIFFSFYNRLWKKQLNCNCYTKIWLWSSSVIEIVKMKYNRIDIKWWLVSTSLNINLEILSNFASRSRSFITTVFHSSVHFLPVLVKGLYQTESYSLHVMQLIRNLNHRRIFLFSTPCGVGSLLAMRNINCKPHWLAICCLSRIFYFVLDRQFRS